MNTILQIFFSPRKAFGELKQVNKFPAMAMIILLLLLAVNMILMVPVSSKITMLTLRRSSMPISEEQLEQALDMLYKLRYLQVFSGIVTSAISLFLLALLLYIMTSVAKPVLDYVKSFTVVVYSYFAMLIGGLVNTGILYFKGIETITNPFEIQLTGLNLFTTMEKAGGGLYTFLSLVNPFQLWFVLLLSIGLKVFTEIKYAKSLLICILFWLITVIIPVVIMIFTEMKMQQAGFM
jgi:hypothetical protein